MTQPWPLASVVPLSVGKEGAGKIIEDFSKAARHSAGHPVAAANDRLRTSGHHLRVMP